MYVNRRDLIRAALVGVGALVALPKAARAGERRWIPTLVERDLRVLDLARRVRDGIMILEEHRDRAWFKAGKVDMRYWCIVEENDLNRQVRRLQGLGVTGISAELYFKDQPTFDRYVYRETDEVELREELLDNIFARYGVVDVDRSTPVPRLYFTTARERALQEDPDVVLGSMTVAERRESYFLHYASYVEEAVQRALAAGKGSPRVSFNAHNYTGNAVSGAQDREDKMFDSVKRFKSRNAGKILVTSGAQHGVPGRRLRGRRLTTMWDQMEAEGWEFGRVEYVQRGGRQHIDEDETSLVFRLG